MHRDPNDSPRTPRTITNHCGYQANGIRISVIFPHRGGFAIANRTSGYDADGNRALVVFPTLDAAKADCVRRNPNIAVWKQEEVPQ